MLKEYDDIKEEIEYSDDKKVWNIYKTILLYCLKSKKKKKKKILKVKKPKVTTIKNGRIIGYIKLCRLRQVRPEE